MTQVDGDVSQEPIRALPTVNSGNHMILREQNRRGGTLDSKHYLTSQILDHLAAVAESMSTNRDRSVSKDLEKVLFGLFLDTGISQDELRAGLKRRTLRNQRGRPSLSLIEGGLT
jgi:hypothetical protein